jgi:hypothetical protein
MCVTSAHWRAKSDRGPKSFERHEVVREGRRAEGWKAGSGVVD